MTAQFPTDYVIDASVVAALFVNDQYTLQARKLFDQLSDDIAPIFYAPDAIYYEVLGVMRKHTLRFGYTTMQHDVQLLWSIPFEITSTHDLLISAADISQRFNVSTYDAIYLALAQRLNIPLVTADQRLVGATQGAPFDVRFIGNLLI